MPRFFLYDVKNGSKAINLEKVVSFQVNLNSVEYFMVTGVKLQEKFNSIEDAKDKFQTVFDISDFVLWDEVSNFPKALNLNQIVSFHVYGNSIKYYTTSGVELNEKITDSNFSNGKFVDIYNLGKGD